MGNEKFFNRELSWIEFNYRVLEEALDQDIPLLERLKFISIFSNNLDEFVMVRISALASQVKSGYNKKDPSGMTPKEILDRLQKRIVELVKIKYDCFNNDILLKLEKEGFRFYTAKNIPKQYIPELEELFIKKYFLIITPMGIDQARPFPFLTGKNINILVNLKQHKKDDKLYAVIPVPAKDRFVPIPGDLSGKKYIYIEELIKLFLNKIFEGYDIIQTCAFRITRDAELSIDEEDVVDLLSAIEDQLKKRAKGVPIRLEIESIADNELVKYLHDRIKFYEGFYFSVNGPLDLASFFDIISIDNYDNLKLKPLPAIMPLEFANKSESMFDIISKKDRLIYLPFESFEPVIRFVEEAANDEKVLAIKITLYRISKKSPIILALKKAAENGKQVTALIELKARFDEAQNIDRAKQLEKVGCHVVYGLVGLKIHSKITLIVRDEPEGIKRYIHLSTGNYNENTAKIYTDIGLFTSRKSFGEDVSSIFNLLTGFSEPPRWKKLVCAPLDLRNFFIERINIEINNVKNSGKGKIIAKMNSLIDIKIINELYRASKAGVKIKLIVRGMCSLKPQVKGLSENITVISIVDRFLEHSRIFYFYDSGDENIFISSADWMERNLDRRVEVLFPILDIDLKKEIIESLNITLHDNKKARILQPDGLYKHIELTKNEKYVHSQMDMYKNISKKNTVFKEENLTVFKPQINPEEEKKLYT